MIRPELFFGAMAQEMLAIPAVRIIYPGEIFEQIVEGLATSNPSAEMEVDTHRGGIVTGTLTDTDGQQYKVTVEPI